MSARGFCSYCKKCFRILSYPFYLFIYLSIYLLIPGFLPDVRAVACVFSLSIVRLRIALNCRKAFGSKTVFFKDHFLDVGALKSVQGKVSTTNYREFCGFYKIGSLNLNKLSPSIFQHTTRTRIFERSWRKTSSIPVGKGSTCDVTLKALQPKWRTLRTSDRLFYVKKGVLGFTCPLYKVFNL